MLLHNLKGILRTVFKTNTCPLQQTAKIQNEALICTPKVVSLLGSPNYPALPSSVLLLTYRVTLGKEIKTCLALRTAWKY